MSPTADPAPPLPIREWHRRLDGVTLADRRRLRRRIDRAKKAKDPATRATAAADLDRAIAAAEAHLERRRAAVPEVTYPPLPVSERRDDLAAAIEANQVVIVAGETGSGKTTQLPKICLELGRGVAGMIGHTQPRRLAARTVADRIADELGVELGGAVGYAVRFADQVGDDTLIKLMTDGLLLAEIHGDRTLSAYDTIIVDEAHERSLNVDFLLGFLQQLLPRRPDLKVIVTSATIDPERFSRYFDDAPIVEVSGRTYPVEVRYRPLDPGDQGDGGDGGSARRRPARDQIQGICDAIDELSHEPPGDVLVFLSGEREIRDTAGALADLCLPDTEVLPLYARLPAAEQRKVFAPHPGRRIVLATNVAETSLTVSGIRYVVDPGTARTSRYSHRLKVQRLPIEPVSQASANQRAGRCGRVAPGVCIRLYAEDDFEARPLFGEPEILRTNLASVILQMAALDLGDIERFGFLDPPDRRAVTDGLRLLHELGALTEAPTARGTATGTSATTARLTPVGRQLARLPVDPRFARMLVEADRTGCLREVLIIVAGLSIEDPRERPTDEAGAADALHHRFRDPSSDFLSYLSLWRYVREQQRELGSSRFRKLCRAEHLNFLRTREWQDVHSQLRQVCAELGMRAGGGDAHPDTVHRALLSGLLSHIGLLPEGERRDRGPRELRGARGARFAIWPGSALAKKPPTWVMAAELVETSRLWGRTVARIQPEWAEDLGAHLVTRTHLDPHWSAEQGRAMVHESVSLYGLPIVTRRLVGLAAVDPSAARDLFVHHALAEGEWRTNHRFVAENRRLLDEVDLLEHRFRRRDLLVDTETLAQLYDNRIPDDVTSTRHFDAWWKKARRRDPDLLTFTLDDLIDAGAPDLDEEGFPEEWAVGEVRLPLSYLFDPGNPADGVTVHVPVDLLNQLSPEVFEWHVPALREELVVALVRGLPKALRVGLTPLADSARQAIARSDVGREPLLRALTRELSAIGGVPIPHDAWDVAALPPHLRVHLWVEDREGRVLAEGDDLDALRRRLDRHVRAEVAGAAAGTERAGITEWDLGELPRRVERRRGDRTLVGYPALVDEGESVRLTVAGSESEQLDLTWAGERRLLLLAVPVARRELRRRVADGPRPALLANPYDGPGALVDDCVTAAVDQLMAEAGAPAWDAVAFDRLRAHVAGHLTERVATVVDRATRVLASAATIDRRVTEPAPPRLHPALDDVAAQRAALVHDGFVAAVGPDRLADVDRYLRAAVARLDALAGNVRRDAERMATVHRVEAAYARALDAVAPGSAAELRLEPIGWMIEELRVNLFAQQIGTPAPVSEKRVMTALAAAQA